MAGRWLVLSAAALAALVALACGGDEGGEPTEFAKFADRIARAVEERDVAFFTQRVRGQPHTCTREEVEANQGPNPPPRPLCLEVGFQFEQVYISTYAAQGSFTSKESLIADLDSFFQQALANEEDQYGPGAVRLYATAVPEEAGGPSPSRHTALLTAILEVNGQRGRHVRGIDFTYKDGRWIIPGETVAGFPVAVELLEPSSADLIYEGWRRYE